MAMMEGYDPTLAGGRGGYALGSFQGGPDPNAGMRDRIASAIMQQQAAQAPMDIARGPDQGQPFQTVGADGAGRQPLGNQGWSIEGNNVFDPSGNIVGRHGAQQYGDIPGLSRPGGGGAGSDDYLRSLRINPFGAGSSLSGGMPSSSYAGDSTGLPSSGSLGGNFTGGSVGAPGTFAPGSATSASPLSSSFPGGAFTGGPTPTPAGFPEPTMTFAGRWGGTGIPIAQPDKQPGGGWPSGRSTQQGPDPNDPGDQDAAAAAAAAAAAQGWGGDFGGFSPGAGGWGGYGDFGGFAGSGFNGSGSYSGGYDTAAGNVGY